jgi:hypothetical protein
VQCVTEHFDPDGVGPPAKLRIGAYDVVYFRQLVPDPILVLFRDSQWTRVQTDVNWLEEPIYSYTFESPAEEIRARLALYGINDDTFRTALGRCRAGLEGFGPRPGLQSRDTYLRRLAVVDSFEYLAPLVSARVEWNLKDMYAARSYRPVAEDMLAALYHLDPRLIIYACVTVAPTATAVLDLTDLVSADGVEEWWIRPDRLDLCAAAVTRLSAMAMMPPIRVLTEGPTDERFIGAAFEILRPDIADLMTFVNPRAKAARSASALAGMVKQFAAARVEHPVVALFDNDAVGRPERDKIPTSALPANIRIATLPDIALAKTYPTIDRDGGSQIEDVNGRACGIEMYLGTDVLTDNGSLEPVQWSADAVGTELQGWLARKSKVQARYCDKVKRARADPSAVPGMDWDGMRAVIETILGAASPPRAEGSG